mmetsp:Transcript_32404/g.97918  ORF Transcript_32404/g.97918 Transcript_32404/m.97918 type:complete len:322 (-) Transcript_32404:166-1131(-)
MAPGPHGIQQFRHQLSVEEPYGQRQEHDLDHRMAPHLGPRAGQQHQHRDAGQQHHRACSTGDREPDLLLRVAEHRAQRAQCDQAHGHREHNADGHHSLVPSGREVYEHDDDRRGKQHCHHRILSVRRREAAVDQGLRHAHGQEQGADYARPRDAPEAAPEEQPHGPVDLGERVPLVDDLAPDALGILVATAARLLGATEAGRGEGVGDLHVHAEPQRGEHLVHAPQPRVDVAFAVRHHEHTACVRRHPPKGHDRHRAHREANNGQGRHEPEHGVRLDPHPIDAYLGRCPHQLRLGALAEAWDALPEQHRQEVQEDGQEQAG